MSSVSKKFSELRQFSYVNKRKNLIISKFSHLNISFNFRDISLNFGNIESKMIPYMIS